MISAGDQVQVEFGVTEKTRSNLAAGDTVAISKNGTDYSGRVTEIGSMVNPSTGLYDVKAEVDRADGLTSGTRVKLTAVLDQARGVMTVPVDAVNYAAGQPFVYCYEDGVAKKTMILGGIYDSQRMGSSISGVSSILVPSRD